MSEPFRIYESATFRTRLKGIQPPGLQERIEERLKISVYPQLKEQPFHGPNIKKLRDYRPDTWRYRLGSWRLIYQIDEATRIVSLLTIRPRKDAY